MLLNGRQASGWIDHKDWNANPKKIKYKDKNGKELSYTTADVQYFEVGTDKYQRSVVDIDLRAADELEPFSGEGFKTDTVFLKVIVSGKPLNLYQYHDLRTQYYYSVNGGKAEALVYAVNDIQYKKQLRDLEEVNWTDSSLAILYKMNYTGDELAMLVMKLNNSNEFNVAYETKKQKKICWFAGAGVAYQTMRFTGVRELKTYTDLEFSPSVSPMISAGMDLFLGLNERRSAIRISISAYSFNTTSNSDTTPSSSYRKLSREYVIKQFNVMAAAGFTYNYISTPSIKSYFGANFGVIFSSYKENSFDTRDISTGEIVNSGTAIDFQNTWPAIGANTGVIFNNKIEARISANLIGSFLRYPSLAEKGLKSSLMLFYRFR